MPTPPILDTRIVQALLEDLLPQAMDQRLVLVYGRYEGRDEFALTNGTVRRRVHVTDQHSVLGIVEAWQDHQAAHISDDDLLVVATSVDDRQLGWDIKAYAWGRATLTVDKAKIVAQRFGAVDVDPRIRAEQWLMDALLAAEPPEGWPRNGSVLTRDTAIRALIGARLGATVLGDSAPDAAALLAWTLDPVGPTRFRALGQAEREGLTRWLVGAIGDVAQVVLDLAADGRGGDVLPLGVIGAVAEVSTESALAFGGLLGGVQHTAVQALVAAVESTLDRWVVQADSAAARHRVLGVLKRADELAATAHLSAALAFSRYLPSAFTTRLQALARSLTPNPRPADIAEAERSMENVREHCLARLVPDRCETAEMAVRLVRWLSEPGPAVGSVAEGVREQLRTWAWVDRAAITLWGGDPGGDPVVGQAYRSISEAVVARRDQLDEQFAQRLQAWTQHASTHGSGGCLLIERVLAEIAVPVAGRRAPLIVVLDGMSGAVAVQLGEQAGRRSWLEAVPTPGERVAAVSVIPSVTLAGRASLLSGTATVGEQRTEREGFAAFWRRHRRAASLFHKADIAGPTGHRLADELVTALAGEGVVGVVLNTIDDALDHGREGDRTRWTLNDVTYLPELLDHARSYGRPVVLTADHGHVLERGGTLVSAPGVESARWRTGTPGEGEILLTGPRVLYGDGAIVAPWREAIRYKPRKAGYHGGASLAEMSVPVMVLLPSPDLVPQGWHVLAPEQVVPHWWEPQPSGTVLSPPPARKRKPKSEDSVPLFSLEPAADTLGTAVVATEIYDAQRAFVPKAPDKAVVAAVIDALVKADNVVSLTAVAAVAGRAARRPEFFAATLQRLLNVDGYPILSLVDGDRRIKLDLEKLQLQFGVKKP